MQNFHDNQNKSFNRAMEKYGIYKDEFKEFINKDGLDKTWDNFRTYFTEYYFELKEDNGLNKKHVGFVADDTIDHPRVEESQMTDALNNLANADAADATNLTSLRFTNENLAEQLKVALSQNKVLTDFPEEIYMRCHRNSVRKS